MFMMYLYVGSIVAIMCIYISVLLDNCPSLSGGGGRGVNATSTLKSTVTNATSSAAGHLMTLNSTTYDPESGSVVSFGTLRRAHIDRNKVSRTSFYLRVGALGEAPHRVVPYR